MTSIKSYLLRLIFCAFLTALCGTLLRGKRAGKLIGLCGGCLLMLTALCPLLRVDLSRLPDPFTGLTQLQREAEAREQNDALLRRLVEEQTSAWVEEQARDLGMTLRCSAAAKEAGESCFVPCALELRGRWTEGQKQALSAILRQRLQIPDEAQTWVEE